MTCDCNLVLVTLLAIAQSVVIDGFFVTSARPKHALCGTRLRQFIRGHRACLAALGFGFWRMLTIRFGAMHCTLETRSREMASHLHQSSVGRTSSFVLGTSYTVIALLSTMVLEQLMKF